MKKRILMAILLIASIIPQISFARDKISGQELKQDKAVSIFNQGRYFKVILDYTAGLTRRQIGEALGTAILKAVPDYEKLIDSYITQTITNYQYPEILYRVADLKINLEQDYRDEIEGIAAKFSGGTKNIRGDGKISRDEFYLFNLFPDVVRGSQCNYISVFGERSATGKTMLARTLDWYGGSHNQLPRIQAVIIFKYRSTQVCSIGYLGYHGILSGFNTQKVFAAILDSTTGPPFSSMGKRSYPFDVRYALEHKTTLAEVAAFMLNPRHFYTVNHLVALADPNESKIVENNFSGRRSTGQQVRRALRSHNSRLHKGITWGFTNAIGAVNSFLLYGNTNNHTPNKFNTKRWENMKKQLASKGAVVTLEELKEVAAFNHGSPGTFSDSGDLYNKTTLHIIIFQPDSLSLQVFFHPRHTRQSPKKPVYENVKAF